MSIIKAVVGSNSYNTFSLNFNCEVRFLDTSTGFYNGATFSPFIAASSVTDLKAMMDTFETQILAEAVTRSYAGFTALDVLWSNEIFNKDVFTKVPSVASRSLNSAFQISTTQNARVSYAVDINTTLNLTGGAAGTATLQYADDSAFTTNVKTIVGGIGSNTGTLTIGLALSQTTTVTLSGFIPIGKYVKIVTANTTGTPTFTYRNGQEVLEN